MGAIDRANIHPKYSEVCSAQLCVTYSSGSGEWIHTTDRNGCTNHHGGTSAAAPLVAGILALVLSVRPELTWRDVQHLIVRSSLPINIGEPDWQHTPAGRMVSHKYGYGRLDAYQIVTNARSWNLTNPQTFFASPVQKVNTAIPHGSCFETSLTVNSTEIAKVAMKRLEHVTATINIEHPRRGGLEIILTSPAGIKSILATKRPSDYSDHGIKDWIFMSVFHWCVSILSSFLRTTL